MSRCNTITPGSKKIVYLVEEVENSFCKPPEFLKRMAKTQSQSAASLLSTPESEDFLQAQLADKVAEFFNRFDKSRRVTANIRNAVSSLKSYLESFEINIPGEEVEERVNDVVHLLELLRSTQVQQLSEIPSLLTMICLLWGDEKQLPDTMTDLYKNSVSYLARHLASKDDHEKEDPDADVFEDNLDDMLKELGAVALKGLFDNRLVFPSTEFRREVLEKACKIGVLTKERKRSKLRVVNQVTFIHKTFQEFCVAFPFVQLPQDDQTRYLKRVQKQADLDDLGLLLQFCCGLCRETAKTIFKVMIDMICRTWGQDFPDIGQLKNMNVLGLHGADRAYHPLLWLKEINSSTFLKFMQPLFESTKVTIEVPHESPSYDALSFFVNCLLQFHNQNVLEKVLEAELGFVGSSSEKQEALAADLLKCMPKLQKLHVRVIMDGWDKEIEDSMGAIRNSLSAIKTLRTLKISGNENGYVYGLFDSLNTGSTITTLTSMSVASPEISADSLSKFLSKQTALSTLKVHGMFQNPDTGVFQRHRPKRLIQADDSKQWLLLSDPFEVQSHMFFDSEVEQLLKSTSCLTELVLRKCSVNGMTLCPQLLHLQVLDLQCPKSFQGWGPPFDSGPLFDAMMKAGSQLQEQQRGGHEQYPHPKPLPLRVLQLANAEIQYSAAKTMLSAFLYLGNLERLDFGPDSLDEASTKYLAKALRYLTTLKCLDLATNRIGHSMIELNQGMRHLVNLKELHLDDTFIDDTGIATIPFEWLTELTTLYINEGQDFTAEGFVRLLRQVAKGRKLTTLHVTYQEEWIEWIQRYDQLMFTFFLISHPFDKPSCRKRNVEPWTISMEFDEVDIRVLKKACTLLADHDRLA